MLLLDISELLGGGVSDELCGAGLEEAEWVKLAEVRVNHAATHTLLGDLV